MDKFDIILRTCGRVNCFSGRPRCVTAVKEEVILRSASSLISSIIFAQDVLADYEMSLTVIDDNSDPTTTAGIKNLLNLLDIEARFIRLEGTGFGVSLAATYDYALANCEDMVYIVEDDYLHHVHCIHEMAVLAKQLKTNNLDNFVLHPCDYPDRYREDIPAKILLGPSRHWRTINKTTVTFALPIKTLKYNIENFKAMTGYGVVAGVNEDTSINKVYETVPCLSPMPTLAVHMQYEETISPYVNWRDWWDDCAPLERIEG